MTIIHDDDRNRLRDWLALLGGAGYRGREARDRAVAEMRAAGSERLFPLLSAMLADPDPKVRCKACEAILWVDDQRGVELVLPLLKDPDPCVRENACGLMHDFGNERAVGPLVERMRIDSDPQIRGTAAYALGGIGSPSAIPALVEILDTDHEHDQLGHSPSSCAAGALDDILGTNETRIRLSNTLCKMRPQKPDLDRLKRMAIDLFQRWCERGDLTTDDFRPGAP